MLERTVLGNFWAKRAWWSPFLVTGASSRIYGVFRFKRFFAIVWAFTPQGAIPKVLFFSTVTSLSRFFSIFKIFRAYKKSYSSASNILLRYFCFSSALFLLSLKDRIAWKNRGTMEFIKHHVLPFSPDHKYYSNFLAHCAIRNMSHGNFMRAVFINIHQNSRLNGCS